MVKNRMLYQLFSRRNFFHFQLIHAGKGSVSSSSASLSSSCSSPRNPIIRTISLTRTPSVVYTVSCSNPLKKGLTSLTKIPVFFDLSWLWTRWWPKENKLNPVLLSMDFSTSPSCSSSSSSQTLSLWTPQRKEEPSPPPPSRCKCDSYPTSQLLTNNFRQKDGVDNGFWG